MSGWSRAALLLFLSLALGLSFVAFASVEDVPADSIRDQQTKRVITDSGAHVGERVIIGGTVVETDPTVIRLAGETVRDVSVTGVERGPLPMGYQVYIFGELVAADRVIAHRVLIEEPWEIRNMYVASFLGGLLVFGRLGFHWRFDRSELALLPRTGETTERGDDNG